MARKTGDYPHRKSVAVDWEDNPSVIIAVRGGDPLVLFVPETTLKTFDVVRKKLRLTHVGLANKIRETTNNKCLQFCSQSIDLALNNFLKQGKF